MFKNYLLLSLKVLKRKPFYTFISLFGISFTLMILMLLTSLFDAMLGDNQPLTHRDRIIIAPSLERTRTEVDTIMTIDTVALTDGGMRYDTAYTYEEEVVSNSNGPMSWKFVDGQLRDFEYAANYAFYNDNGHIDGYLDGRKFSFAPYYTTASYWDVFDFKFLEGGRFLPEDEAQASKVAVVTDKAAREYFGTDDATVIGREMNLGGELYTVRGIVARPYSDSPMFGGDVYLPVTTIDQRSLDSEEVYGGFSAVFLTEKPEHRRLLQEEINFLADNYQLPPDSYYDAVEVFNATFLEGYAQGILQERDPNRAVRLMFIPIIILVMLFVALPLLNLVNLNIGRVHERKAEIGVRKAFGANGRDILWQFIFENLVLTVIGGTVGLLLALALINYVNANDLLGITRLSYSPDVFVYFLLVILAFGFLSGILPAYRMSRTSVANSLR